MKTKNNNTNAFLIHISAFAGYFFPLGSVVVPLIFWQLKKEDANFIDEHGKEAVNFNLSFLLYTFILGLAIVSFLFKTILNLVNEVDHTYNQFAINPFGSYGFFGSISVLGILGFIRFILIILAATKANNGETYKYPFTIKFVK